MKIIVSLTSFPAAIPFAVNAIKSIMNQSVLPDKIVLYLTAEQFPDKKLPAELLNLVESSSLFEIRFYSENIRSYTKLIPALKDFPDDIIITIDDDINYPRDLIKKLLRAHKKYPNAIVAHRVRRVRWDADGNLLPYKKWGRYMRLRYYLWSCRPRLCNLLTGVGGVLYPPHSLPPEASDAGTFMKLAPTTDDIWFWLMAAKTGTGTAPVRWGFVNQLGDMHKPRDITLSSVNIKSAVDVNRENAEKIIAHYKIKTPIK
ncbi:MAG: hypothetical protein LBB23_03295 [Rickettsiales bacterium]|jgi:hypothetical protein|nr:hypothetical protein [Rickettsiales bacterium]